jgi:hypothetical protein
MAYREIKVGEAVELRGGRRFTPVPANHTVPAVGYVIDNGRNALIFSGDTSTNDALWKVVNRTQNLKYLIIETAFSNKERDIAVASKHLCPKMLAEELEKIRACRSATPQARRGRAYHEGGERGGGTLAAADAGKQPGILTLGDTKAGVEP